MKIPFIDYGFSEGFFLFVFIGFLFALFVFAFMMRKHLLRKLSFAPELATFRTPFLFWTKSLLYLFAWGLASVALSDPRSAGTFPESVVQKTAPPLKSTPHEVVLVVDASGSMSAQDARQNSRFSFAKETAEEVLLGLQGEALSLYSFTTSILQHAPPTTDYLFVRMMLENLEIGDSGSFGTDFFTVLNQLKHVLERSSVKKSVVLLSDGDDTKLEVLKSHSKEQHIRLLASILSGLENVTVYSVGIGSEEGSIVPDVSFEGKPVISSLNEPLLKALATGRLGKYYSANAGGSLNIANDIQSLLSEAREKAEKSAPEDRSQDLVFSRYFQVPLFLAILCLIAALTLPQAAKAGAFFILPLCLACFSVFSEEMPQDQMILAKAYADTEEYLESAFVYESLLKSPLSPVETATVFYNLGTVALLQNNLDDAISFFDKIPLDSLNNPELIYKVQYNLSFGLFKKASTLVLSRLPGLSDEDYSLAKGLLINALQHLERAKLVDCMLSSLEGFSTCQQETALQTLENEISQVLNIAFDKNVYFRFNMIPADEGILLLRSFIEKTLAGFAVLEHLKEAERLKENNTYKDLSLSENDDWKRFWNHLESAVKEEKNQIDLNLFLNAKQLFFNAQEQLEKNNFDSAEKELKEALSDLEAIGKTPKKPNTPLPSRKQTNKSKEPPPSFSSKTVQMLLQMEMSDKIPRKQNPSIEKETRPW